MSQRARWSVPQPTCARRRQFAVVLGRKQIAQHDRFAAALDRRSPRPCRNAMRDRLGDIALERKQDAARRRRRACPRPVSSTAVVVIEAGRPMIPAARLVGHSILDRHRPVGLAHREIGAVLRRDPDPLRLSKPFAAADRARAHLVVRQEADEAIVRLADPQDAGAGGEDIVLLVRIEHPAGRDIEHEIGRPSSPRPSARVGMARPIALAETCGTAGWMIWNASAPRSLAAARKAAGYCGLRQRVGVDDGGLRPPSRCEQRKPSRNSGTRSAATFGEIGKRIMAPPVASLRGRRRHGPAARIDSTSALAWSPCFARTRRRCRRRRWPEARRSSGVSWSRACLCRCSSPTYSALSLALPAHPFLAVGGAGFHGIAAGGRQARPGFLADDDGVRIERDVGQRQAIDGLVELAIIEARQRKIRAVHGPALQGEVHLRRIDRGRHAAEGLDDLCRDTPGTRILRP